LKQKNILALERLNDIVAHATIIKCSSDSHYLSHAVSKFDLVEQRPLETSFYSAAAAAAINVSARRDCRALIAPWINGLWRANSELSTTSSIGGAALRAQCLNLASHMSKCTPPHVKIEVSAAAPRKDNLAVQQHNEESLFLVRLLLSGGGRAGECRHTLPQLKSHNFRA